MKPFIEDMCEDLLFMKMLAIFRKLRAIEFVKITLSWGFPGDLLVKNLLAKAKDTG